MLEVTAFESGKFWAVDIPALEGMTQALIRDEIEAMTFDYFECQTGQKADPASFKFTILEGLEALVYSRKVQDRFDEIDRELEAFASTPGEIAS